MPDPERLPDLETARQTLYWKIQGARSHMQMVRETAEAFAEYDESVRADERRVLLQAQPEGDQFRVNIVLRGFEADTPTSDPKMQAWLLLGEREIALSREDLFSFFLQSRGALVINGWFPEPPVQSTPAAAIEAAPTRDAVFQAAVQLDAVIQMLESGMSVLPFGQEGATFDGARDRLRAAVEAYDAAVGRAAPAERETP